MLKGNTYETVVARSGYSLRKLEKAFHQFFTQSPPFLVITQPLVSEAYLILDALWFGKRFCLMLYRQSRSKLILHASFMSKEYGSLIAKDLILLKKRKYRITVVVSDGGTGIRKAVWQVYGHIPHQICLAHLHRQVINALGRHPKDIRVKQLKVIADHLWLIESREALMWWKEQLGKWTRDNREFLGENRTDTTGHWWYIHHGVRKAVKLLVSAPDASFVFLTHPLIPKTTNELEGQIGNLSAKQVIHQGLKRERTQSFLTWFIYFYNRRLLSQRKTEKA